MLKHNRRAYKPLPLKDSEDEYSLPIRLVCIKPGAKEQEIECVLMTTTIRDAEFEALSYAWGQTIWPMKIRVDGMPYYVTHNLYTALQELRRVDRERRIWVDAMAINQDDKVEKNSQIPLIRTIYFRASQVIIWLGKSTAQT
ncbi:hypothetical protein BS50DRAFT_497564, partial [Corynespora cassiicola Philippines]